MRSRFGWAWILTLSLSAGCSFGVGSSFVGQWREQEKVVFEMCRVDSAGTCVDRRQVKQTEPERRFMGTSWSLPSIGLASLTSGGRTHTMFAGRAGLEVLRGKGRFAWGVRALADLFAGSDITMRAITAMGVVHWNVWPRLTIYAGAGYSPFSSLSLGQDSFRSYQGGSAELGVQVVVLRSVSSFLTWEIESIGSAWNFDRENMSLLGVVSSIGLHL